MMQLMFIARDILTPIRDALLPFYTPLVVAVVIMAVITVIRQK
ncbi:MAG: hypothetical protein WC471_03745 [Candidatus Woesearchaeota archaeon]